MTRSGMLLLSNNDNLETVIKKCNTNFKSVLIQQKQSESLASQSQETFEGEIEELVAEKIGEAVDSLVETINSEANTRSRKDDDLEDAIETVDNKFANYTLSTDLAAVATSGDYNDLATKPTDPVNSAYLTFDAAYDPNVSIGGTWVAVGTLAIGVETIYAWKRTT